MYHLALINETTHTIEAPEAIELEAHARRRFRSYDLEARARGGDWKAYIGDKPFEWPVTEAAGE
jgi:hypothetical protein